MFMHVPCYNLPATHRALKAKGVLPRMLTAPSYIDVLRQASSRPSSQAKGRNLTPEERGVQPGATRGGAADDGPVLRRGKPASLAVDDRRLRAPPPAHRPRGLDTGPARGAQPHGHAGDDGRVDRRDRLHRPARA